MKVRKLKTRIAAFGLAVLMGASTLSSANAFAAEQTGSEQQTEVQAVTSQKDTSVTADDITKAVSDDTFAVETSMEGIHYDTEKEEVTLVSIKDENGGEYHSDMICWTEWKRKPELKSHPTCYVTILQICESRQDGNWK